MGRLNVLLAGFPISKEKPLFCIRLSGAKQGSNRWSLTQSPVDYK
jgi:hypothetical protein